jgi:glycosyltransferase involved in cell wall biosynthesis
LPASAGPARSPTRFLIVGEATCGEEDEGRAILDGLATGLPMVSSDCDGVLDIVVEGETGLMVPPRDGAKLAVAVGAPLGDAARGSPSQ